MRGLLKWMPIGKDYVRAYGLMQKLRDCPAARHLQGYSSPIPSLSQIKTDHDWIFAIPKEFPGIDLNVAGHDPRHGISSVRGGLPLPHDSHATLAISRR